MMLISPFSNPKHSDCWANRNLKVNLNGFAQVWYTTGKFWQLHNRFNWACRNRQVPLATILIASKFPLLVYVHMHTCISQVVDDPSGNSFVENRVAPSPNPHLSVEFYHRTQEQNKALNISPASIEVSWKKCASGRGIDAKCLFSHTSQKSSIKSSTLSFTNSLDRFRP